MSAMFELKRQRTMLDEGPQKVGVALDRSSVGSGRVDQFLHVGDCNVGWGIHLEVAPEILNRVELRRVQGEEGASPDQRCHQKAGLVDEDQPRSSAPGVFYLGPGGPHPVRDACLVPLQGPC